MLPRRFGEEINPSRSLERGGCRVAGGRDPPTSTILASARIR